MPNRPLPTAHDTARWRLVVLALLALLIVVGPSLVIRDATLEAEQAQMRVSHTREVNAIAYAVMFNQRELESAVLMRYATRDTPWLRDRIGDAQAAIPPLLDRLTRLTADNSAQQVRVGRIRTLLEQRGQAARALTRLPSGQTDARLLNDLVLRSHVRQAAEELIQAEELMLASRTQRARRLRDEAEAINWISAAAQLLLLGGLGWVWQRQIGGRLRAERASASAEARSRSVLQTVREPIVLLDEGARIVMHNSAFSELYAAGGEIPSGRALEAVGDGAWADPILLRRLADVSARARELWDHEQEQRTSDGTTRTMLVNARLMPLPDSDDKVTLVTLSDVTVQKAAEAQMRELNRQLEGKVEQVSDINRELEAFSYSVSHDLRAPLRHVAGFADKLGRHLGEAADDRSRHYIEVIGSSARRMSQLIDDLLVYSRLGRGAMQLKAVDMQSLVAETRAILDSNLAADAPQRRVDWVVAPMPIVVADENMMRQVWLNLLGNAIKYSDRAERARIEVLYERDADNAHHFRVRDNGAGFDMQYAGKLFGVFQRMHKASDYPGTGIGLASVRRVLQRHGGRIWAESAIDAGSTFHFVLPASLDALPSKSGAPA